MSINSSRRFSPIPNIGTQISLENGITVRTVKPVPNPTIVVVLQLYESATDGAKSKVCDIKNFCFLKM